MKRLLLATCFLLAGCPATLPPKVETVGKDIPVAVATKCIDRKDLKPTPSFPLDLVDLEVPMPLAALAHAARLELKARREFVASINEILQKCSQ